MAEGPPPVPCWGRAVRSSGTGKMTAREVSYWECSSLIPPKLSGGIGVYRLISGPRWIFRRLHCEPFRERGRAEESVIVAEKNRGGEDGGPKAALVTDRRLRDVHGADDLIRDAVNFFFFIPG